MEKKRKNPWHKRKVNQRYNELCGKIENNPDVLSKLNHVNVLTSKLSEKSKEVNSIKKEYDEIVENSSGDLINLLSIETLNDSFNLERDGYLSKITFKDIIRAGSLRKTGMSIAENNMSLVTESKLSQIELVLAQINVILDESEGEK